MDEAYRKQVSDQARVVAHLATAIAKVHAELAPAYASGAMDKILPDVGKRTAELIELFGNIMNAMDIVSEDDEWTSPVVEESQRLFSA